MYLSVLVGIIVVHITDLAFYNAIRCCSKLGDELDVRVLLLFILTLLNLVIRILLDHIHSFLRLTRHRVWQGLPLKLALRMMKVWSWLGFKIRFLTCCSLSQKGGGHPYRSLRLFYLALNWHIRVLRRHTHRRRWLLCCHHLGLGLLLLAWRRQPLPCGYNAMMRSLLLNWLMLGLLLLMLVWHLRIWLRVRRRWRTSYDRLCGLMLMKGSLIC